MGVLRGLHHRFTRSRGGRAHMKIPMAPRTMRPKTTWTAGSKRGLPVAAFLAASGAFALAVDGCVMQPPASSANGGNGKGTGGSNVLTSANAPASAPATPSLFHLKPEWEGPCARAETVDVNLGNSPEAFVRAAHCQITGQEAPPKT